MGYFRKKLITEISVSLLVLLALIGGLLFFGSNIKKYSEQVLREREELATRSVSLQAFAGLRSFYNEKAKGYLSVLYNLIPLEEQLIALNREFQTLANRENLNYGFSFAGETPRDNRGLGALRFGLNLGGELDRLFKFVKSLETFRYLMQIDSVSFDRQAAQFQTVVKGQVFFR